MYEITFITKNENDQKIVKNVLEKNKAKVLYEEKIGRRNFVYPIKKEDAGFYFTTYFDSSPNQISAISKNLHIEADILRFLVLKTKRDINVMRTKTQVQEKKTVKQKEVATKEAKPAKAKVIKKKPTTKKKKVEKKLPKIKEVKKEIKKMVPKKAKKPTKKTVSIKTKISKKEIVQEKKQTPDEQERIKKLEEKLDELLKE